MSPTQQRQCVQRLRRKFLVSERRACKGLGLARSSMRYRRQVRGDEAALRQRMVELARKRPRFGYRRIARLLQQEGFGVNIKRVYRLWRLEGLKVPKKTRKKRAVGNGSHACHRLRAERINHVWCWDFIFDRTAKGQTLKYLSVVDEYTRRCITLDVSRSLKAEAIIDRLAELFMMYGVPECIRSDNGPEFVATAIRRWLAQMKVQTLYIEPGSPWQNGYAESFHSRLRDELLNVEEFENVRHARAHAVAWREDYNEYRPHSSLGGLPPEEFARRCAASGRAAPSLQQHSESVSVPQPLLS
jgi:putative transposase